MHKYMFSSIMYEKDLKKDFLKSFRFLYQIIFQPTVAIKSLKCLGHDSMVIIWLADLLKLSERLLTHSCWECLVTLLLNKFLILFYW